MLTVIFAPFFFIHSPNRCYSEEMEWNPFVELCKGPGLGNRGYSISMSTHGQRRRDTGRADVEMMNK